MTKHEELMKGNRRQIAIKGRDLYIAGTNTPAIVCGQTPLVLCHTNCAWFFVSEPLDPKENKVAFCGKNKLIGEIVND
jgi:hypothetical protein